MPWGIGPPGWNYPPPYYGHPYSGYWGYSPSREEEKQWLLDWRRYLEEQRTYLEHGLEQIDRRVAALDQPEEQEKQE